ncbi:hypothetical protein ACHAXR_004585, partial [Thalassiosira sp. AJA248-18]
SGGSTVKSIYECFGLAQASRVSVDPRFDGAHRTELNEEKLFVYHPWPRTSEAKYVNVDTNSRQGIDRARKLQLVPSGLADIIVTSDPIYAIEKLFDISHKGRVLGLFRHPVDRLVSKFDYIQVASWGLSNKPGWKKLTLEQWAMEGNKDNNHMVKRLAGLGVNATAKEADLHTAMRTLEERFIVGLFDHMEESVHRFNTVMGIDESHERQKSCMDHYFGHDLIGVASQLSSISQVEERSSVWNILAKKNALDIRLYEFITQLFEEQREMIESYESSMTALE